MGTNIASCVQTILIGYFNPGLFCSRCEFGSKTKHPNVLNSDSDVRRRSANVRMRTENNEFGSEFGSPNEVEMGLKRRYSLHVTETIFENLIEFYCNKIMCKDKLG